MNQFKQNALQKIHQERREKKERIRKEFAESGDFAKMRDAIRKKADDRPDVSSLPF